MSSFKTGIQYYLEPLPFRRQPFPDRPLLFSENCPRGHRPSSLDMSGISNFNYIPKPKQVMSPGTFWRTLLADIENVIGPRTASPDQQGNGSSRGEFDTNGVSPVTELESLFPSFDVSPLTDDDSSDSESEYSEYEYEIEPEPSSTQSLFCHTLTPILSLHELGRDRPASAPALRCVTAQLPDSLGMWQEVELSPFDDYTSSDDESLGIGRADSDDSPWEDEFFPLVTTGMANASTICHAPDTPRLFEGLSPPTTTTGEFVSSRSPAFALTGYGTFVVQMPFTPKSPTYSETDLILLYGENRMSEDSGDGVWDFVFIWVNTIVTFVAVSTYMIVLIAILKSSLN
ncbi:hypothetical protein FVEN_g6593 [Fusarium venenatum]|uniref:Uncharacterized protein n=1 Tax=Fusarium venenatum TaxID=56646 RepID=A0A2L2T5V9_9HYPO|nr:uncharacterized protein FVRRES_04897 [Fusarium venenatum]KAG8355565.1 hypothetical protein FVEN_g6593 [Fusarium venenatum]KAH6992029.1 hypothetical protein EDB82DRAFT_553939 [Fusarium venenatum]CEI60461.1 unnamed protein product [Fusarium venenatum]